LDFSGWGSNFFRFGNGLERKRTDAGSGVDTDFESMKKQAVIAAELQAVESFLDEVNGLHLYKSHTVQNIFGNDMFERHYADADGNVRAIIHSGQAKYLFADTIINAQVEDPFGNQLGTINTVIDFSLISRNTVRSSVRDNEGREVRKLHSDVIDGVFENWLETNVVIADRVDDRPDRDQNQSATELRV